MPYETCTQLKQVVKKALGEYRAKKTTHLQSPQPLHLRPLQPSLEIKSIVYEESILVSPPVYDESNADSPRLYDEDILASSPVAASAKLPQPQPQQEGGPAAFVGIKLVRYW